MQSGYYNAVGSMVTQFNKLDLLSNNLANLNTVGFKQDKNIIGDFSRLYQEKRDDLELSNNTQEGSKFFNRTMNKVPQVSEVYTDFRLGALKQTDGKLDLALIDKEKFFAIKVGKEIQLSRSGAFSMDKDGFLVNQGGHKVLDNNQKPIAIPSGEDLRINKDGAIYIDNAYIGELLVGSVDNMKKLTKVGNSNFSLGEQKLHHNNNSSIVEQGFLEQGNVNPVYTMSAMIATNRLLEMSQKAASSQMDDMNNEAINKIAVNR